MSALAIAAPPEGLLERRVDPASDPDLTDLTDLAHPERLRLLSLHLLYLEKNKAKACESGHQPFLGLPLQGMGGCWCHPARDCSRFKVVQPLLPDGISLALSVRMPAGRDG